MCFRVSSWSVRPRSTVRVPLTGMKRLPIAILAICLLLFAFSGNVHAHPLGNFTINHFVRLELGDDQIRVRYVVDMAEIPAFQELQAISADESGKPTTAALDAYVQRMGAQYAAGLVVVIDGSRVPLKLAAATLKTPPGAGGLETLRVECDFAGDMPPSISGGVRRLRFENMNHPDRTGWREIVVVPLSGESIFKSTAFASGVTDELKAYPEDKLQAPLDERTAEFSFAHGAIPAGVAGLRTREGRTFTEAPDRFTQLIAVPDLTLLTALLGLLVAAALGALHALSPGHGKTIVGAYLIGSRGTARHAAFLGLTVTITHTIGVFALGLVTLFASQYVVPERLFPVLGLISGALVFAVGMGLFIRRLRAAIRPAQDETHHHFDHEHVHDGGPHDHVHPHEQSHKLAEGEAPEASAMMPHSHGGSVHTHLPPGADGDRVSWRSLLALGISGGLLPCPSALVVMLSAIALHRVAYGLILVVAFSFGLACTLTAIGLAFVYAGRLMKGRLAASGRLVRWLPAMSAFVIASLGAVICYRALVEAGINPLAFLTNSAGEQMGSLSTFGVLGFGLLFGLKHAVEADHLAAVSTIVSERRSLLSSMLVGGLWGIGHTIALLIAGVGVIVLHLRIGEETSLALEFCVALMLIALGLNAILKLKRGSVLHFHTHRHGGRLHSHPHFHDSISTAEETNTHHGFRFSARPLLIGLLHGLAGSAALMLLVLSTISSPAVGLLYVVVFGAGSIGGMMLMSLLVGLPVHLTAGRFDRANWMIRGMAGVFSLSFGIFMAYRIGFIDRLFG
ncbi:MAG: hypothetical protein QOJ64_1844 [Acidobacteriota bacterium]|nr:hypothetical protein [Acidobacteriota bacterium]